VDVAKTVKAAADAPLYPGGTFTVYGDFCWGGDKQRAEGYFIPAGTKPTPPNATRDPEIAKKAMQQLQEQHMLGSAVAAGDGYVTFAVPDDDKVLDGSGDNAVARLVVYDNKAHRASAIDESTVLTLKATKKPLSWPLIGGMAGLLVVIILLAMVLVRSGGGRRRRGGDSPPSSSLGSPGYGGPVAYGVPTGGYAGAPPGVPTGGYAGAAAGGYAPPPAEGYGSPAMLPEGGALLPTASGGGPPPAAASPGLYAPQATGAAPVPAGALPSTVAMASSTREGSAGPPIAQVRCPYCGMITMATPGQPSVCFSCGQPLPPELTRAGLTPAAPPYASGALPGAGAALLQQAPGPTGTLGLAPPGSPMAGGAANNPYASGAFAPSAGITLRGASGTFTLRPGAEVRVGRDPAQCPVLLPDPRISALHATLKVEGGQLIVRDEGSNNGTWIGGGRLSPGVWTAIPAGAPLRFGPLEFSSVPEA
jgi:hypothetical protein